MSKVDQRGLDAEKLRSALAGSSIGNELVFLEEVGSTNDEIWRRAQAGATEGLVVFAERQNAGRGQRGNHWESAPHLGLWFSVLLRPDIQPVESVRLTSWAAQTIAETVHDELRVRATVKAPNDVIVAERKVAGVLVEMRVEANGSYAAILGIGINVNHQLADFPEALRERAGSLALTASRSVDRTAFAAALLIRLDRTYRACLVRKTITR